MGKEVVRYQGCAGAEVEDMANWSGTAIAAQVPLPSMQTVHPMPLAADVEAGSVAGCVIVAPQLDGDFHPFSFY